MNKIILALGLAVPLGACTTTSFAPPAVNPQWKAHVQGAAGCQARTVGVTEERITHDVEGAMTLTDNFVLAYRCAERELANGRQFFQLPSFAAAAVGLVGPSLGLGHDGSLIAGTTAGLFNTGNGYYAPRAKAGLVSAAHRALVCIKIEAAGVSYFHLVAEDDEEAGGAARTMESSATDLMPLLAELKANAVVLETRRAVDPAAEGQLRANWAQQQAVMTAMVNSSVAAATEAAVGSVLMSAEVQYFQMVSGALLSVESILAERLRDVGSADTKEIFAQLTKLAEQHAAAKKALEDAKKKDAAGTGGTAEAMTMSEATVDERVKLVELENAVLQPKLQVCVLEARN